MVALLISRRKIEKMVGRLFSIIPTIFSIFLRDINKATMGFKRFVEVGRVVLINYGPEEGKLATIVDIVDQNKCLIDGPAEITGVGRQVISFTRISLTDLVAKIDRNAKAKAVKAAWEEGEVLSKWDNSSWAKKLSSKKKRANLNDFERFKVMVARKQKSAIIAKKMAELA